MTSCYLCTISNILSHINYLYSFDKIIQGLGFYHPKIHVLSEMNKTIACSIKKAETELGYSPKIDLKEGMFLSLQWLFGIPELAAQLKG